ncbi:DUF4097 family beta strand repeat-containing protein [Ekhidna sp. MALMAid0563]|uniref:DUF4097 family beta strand repeat-containing protein n=1 Tax=unclassified Ekhidna TaxID=2632188 RepID=UPI0032DE81F1
MKLLLILLTLINPDLKEDRIVINKTYDIPNAEKMLVMIHNMNGDVTVEATEGNQVSLDLTIEISASSDDLIDQAKRDLKLGEYIKNDSLVLYMKAPFMRRCDGQQFWGYNMNDGPDYSFKYQYKLKVPKKIAIHAKTVNNGDVLVRNMEGKVMVSNVNGDIEVENVHDLRRASTVNGDVDITFVKAPQMPVKFHTVNGDFTFELPDDFNAQVYFDSMNGDLYTAFDYKRMSPKVEKSERNGTFKIGTKTGVEIGSGGPELSFKSINGNVYLKKKKS